MPSILGNIGEKRNLFYVNSSASFVIFIITCLFYMHKRNDAAWLERVPYSTYLTRTTFPDSPDVEERLQSLQAPSFKADKGEAYYRDHLTKHMSCDIFSEETMISPRCNCLVRSFLRVLDVKNLNSRSIGRKYREFKTDPGAMACARERGHTRAQLENEDEERTVVFDFILWWWAVATMCHLWAAYSFLEFCSSYSLRALTFGAFFTVLGFSLWVFSRAEYSRASYLLGLFVVPLSLKGILVFVSVLAKRFRGSSAASKPMWFRFHNLFEIERFVLVPTILGFVCSHRLMLLMLHRNTYEENVVVGFLTFFAGMCSFVVRIIHKNLLDMGSPLSEGGLKLSFAGTWIWSTVLIVLVSLQGIYYNVGPNLASLTTFAMYARGAAFVIIVLTLLQMPSVNAALPSTHVQQLAIFHVLELLARVSGMVVLWASLVL